MANCRYKRILSTIYNQGAGRAPVAGNNRPPQFVPQTSRERVRQGDELNTAAMDDQAAKAWIEQLDREMAMNEPLIRMLATHRPGVRSV